MSQDPLPPRSPEASPQDSPQEAPGEEKKSLAPVPRPAAPQGPLSMGEDAEEIAQLVDQAQAGEVDALNELFARYHQRMVEMARRRLGPRLRLKEDADDLAQTTFREATRDFAQYRYRGEGSLLRWLVQILQNKIRDKAEYYSAGKRDISRERSTDDRPDEDGPKREPASKDLSVTSRVQRDEEFEILRQGLAQLSPDHRKAITLVFFQGLPLREAGEKMGGRTEDAVRMLLRRAEAKLREVTRQKLAP